MPAPLGRDMAIGPNRADPVMVAPRVLEVGIFRFRTAIRLMLFIRGFRPKVAIKPPRSWASFAWHQQGRCGV